MTTGIDYTNDFISMDEPDGTRSIVKLEEEAINNGYSNMSDKEIAKLMEYRENKALNHALVQNQIEFQRQQNEILTQQMELQRQQTQALFAAMLDAKPNLRTVDGNEVE